MKIEDLKTYEDLEHFLKTCINFSGDPGPYDFNGLLHLMMAIVDNMIKNSIEADLEDYISGISDDQVAYLQRILSMNAENKRNE